MPDNKKSTDDFIQDKQKVDEGTGNPIPEKAKETYDSKQGKTLGKDNDTEVHIQSKLPENKYETNDFIKTKQEIIELTEKSILLKI